LADVPFQGAYTVTSERGSDGNEFDHCDAELAVFDLRDERLWFA
jgi:hypothetical protein